MMDAYRQAADEAWENSGFEESGGEIGRIFRENYENLKKRDTEWAQIVDFYLGEEK